MVQKIDAASVDVLFGGKKGLDKEIAAFKAALKTHAKTVGVPAPTAHPFVEIIVKQHDGKYELVLPPADPKEPEQTLYGAQQTALAVAADTRYSRQLKGVVYNGSEFSANPASLSALLAAIVATEGDDEPQTWKDRLGGYVPLRRSDMLAILKLAREMTQAAFENERRIRAKIEAANTKKDLDRIDMSKGWPE